MKNRMFIALVIAAALAGSVVSGDSQRRTEKFVIGPVSVTGYMIGHCPDGNFDVLSDFVYLIRGIARFDRSGQFVQEMDNFRVLGERVYYNSVNGKTVSGAPAELENHRFLAESNRDIISGPVFKVRVPGYGTVFSETGHMEFVYVPETNTWEVVGNTGPNQMFDQDLAALCSYLK